VTLDPPAHPGAAPPVLRVRVQAPGQQVDPDRLLLVHGPVGPGQLREITQGKLSAALTKRVVPAMTWADPDGGEAVLAPTTPLDRGEHYTLAAGDLEATAEIEVATADAMPLLPRIWPPEAGATATFGLWCGEAPLPRIDSATTLEPEGPTGRLRTGAVAAGAGGRCVRFEARSGEDEVVSGAWVPPPVAWTALDPSVGVRLDPRPLHTGGSPSPVMPLSCQADERAFGPGCVRVGDDRLYGRSPAAPALWAVAGAGTDQVFSTSPGDPFVIAGLPPSTDVTLDVAVIDDRGATLRALFQATTAAARPHVVLNEVLANPLGPEPDQEWVEIVNDGPAPASLEGYTLLDAGGETPLPPVTLDPGAMALIVNESFVAADGVDPAPAPGTLILRVTRLGKNGLSNAGEPLTLLDGTGAVVSRFPALPRPKAGRSVARRAPAAPDALPGSFDLAAPSPGRTNGW
jgi:hypothetical protein